MLELADPTGRDEGGWGVAGESVSTNENQPFHHHSGGLRCPFASPPYSSSLIDEFSSPASLYGSPSCSLSSSMTCNCTVKEGYVGQFRVRLSLVAAQEPTGFPSLHLDVAQGDSNVLSHLIPLQPRPKQAISNSEAPLLNESLGHPGNKKRKRQEQEEGVLAQGPSSLNETLPSNPHKHQKKRKLLAECKETKGKDSLGKGEGSLVPARVQRHNEHIDGEDLPVGILSLPNELLQHIFLHVPIRHMARLNEVCKQFESVIDNDLFWKHIFSRHFGIPLFLRLSWKQRVLSCSRRAQIYELDLEGSIYGQLSWSAQFGYHQYFRNTLDKYSGLPKSHLQYKIDGDLVRFAATEGFSEIVESITSTHDIISLRDTMRRTGLHHATKYGKMDIVKMLLPHDPLLIEEKDKYGDTPLILAACYGNKAVVEFLLAHNAKVDGKNQDDYTALIFASQNGHAEIVEILLNAGADVNARGNEGTSPLIIASQEGHTDVVRLLLRRKPDLNAQVTASGDTALILAVCYGHEEVVDLLLSHAADPNVVTSHGKTAVFFAASHGKKRILEKIVDAGGIVSLPSLERVTPIMAAVKGGHKDVVEYLLAHGATIDTVDNAGNTALLLAVWQENAEMVKLLLPHITEGRHKEKRTGGKEKRPLKSVTRRKKVTSTARKHTKEKEKEGGKKERMDLTEGEAEKDKGDEEEESERTLLILEDTEESEGEEEADLERSVGGVEGTLATSVVVGVPNLDVRDRSGDSALLMAVRRKNAPLMQLLLESGADALNTVDAQGKNAIGLAEELGVGEVLEPFLPPSEQLRQQQQQRQQQQMPHQEEAAQEGRDFPLPPLESLHPHEQWNRRNL